ncbi:hypothetical protein KCP73_13430 [Salmonella enterica subsp. enterica]|nr:hypothetical protein KCP73_13430 [Salmonella enterica subsp. enterica]
MITIGAGIDFQQLIPVNRNSSPRRKSVLNMFPSSGFRTERRNGSMECVLPFAVFPPSSCTGEHQRLSSSACLPAACGSAVERYPALQQSRARPVNADAYVIVGNSFQYVYQR